jgi:hypothetical protein
VDEITPEDKVEFYNKLSGAVKDDPTVVTVTRVPESGALKFEKGQYGFGFPLGQLETDIRVKALQLGPDAVVTVKFDGKGGWKILDQGTLAPPVSALPA